ncbi:MAG TPA: hypothetical protein VM553_04505 [Dongiaceae bacterium]|nr:hypothetical protein [Dongiaceae bacterium]
MKTFSASRSCRALALAIGISLTLGGCANSPYSLPGMGGGGNTAPAQQQQAAGSADPRLTQNDEAEFFSKSGWQACAGGAIAGALLCQLGNPSDKKDCMLKAALVGCGVGMGANYYLDQRRAEYSNEEQRLDQMIKDVQEDNRKLTSLTQTARTVMAEDRAQIAQLKKDIAANKVQKTQAQQQLAEIDANTKYLQKTLADLKSREQQWRQVAASEQSNGARVDTLNAEINQMQRQIASLETEIDSLFQQRSAIKVG